MEPSNFVAQSSHGKSDYDRFLQYLRQLYDVAIVDDEARQAKVHAMPPFTFPDDPEDHGVVAMPRLLCFDKYTHEPMRMYYRLGKNKELIEAAFDPSERRWEQAPNTDQTA